MPSWPTTTFATSDRTASTASRGLIRRPFPSPAASCPRSEDGGADLLDISSRGRRARRAWSAADQTSARSTWSRSTPVRADAMSAVTAADAAAGQAEAVDQIAVQLGAQPFRRGVRPPRLLQQVSDGDDELGCRRSRRVAPRRRASPAAVHARARRPRTRPSSWASASRTRVGHEVGERLVPPPVPGFARSRNATLVPWLRHEDVRRERRVVLRVEPVVDERARAARCDDPARSARLARRRTRRRRA